MSVAVVHFEEAACDFSYGWLSLLYKIQAIL